MKTSRVGGERHARRMSGMDRQTYALMKLGKVENNDRPRGILHISHKLT